MSDTLVDLILSGKWLPAVGAALVLLVGAARYGLAKISPWFGTKLGGYVLAYVSAFALYLGTAFQSGTPINAHRLLTAFAAALSSSGLIDHWRDIFSVVKKVPAAAGAAASVAIVILVVSCSNCAGTTPSGGSVIASVVSCTAADGDVASRI